MSAIPPAPAFGGGGGSPGEPLGFDSFNCESSLFIDEGGGGGSPAGGAVGGPLGAPLGAEVGGPTGGALVGGPFGGPETTLGGAV